MAIGAVPVVFADAPGLAAASDALFRGELVGLPTETVYGLAADALQPAAVERVFAVKGRPAAHPLIVHIGRATQLDECAVHVSALAHTLAEVFWPGPLTLVMARHPRIPLQATAGRETVAVRVPSHPVAQALLERVGRPLVAPSANLFGRVSPTLAEHVAEAFRADQVSMVLDGGPCAFGIESTIVDLSGQQPALLRPGAIAKDHIEATIGQALVMPQRPTVAAPGQHPSHYAPGARLWLAPSQEAAREEVIRLRALGQPAGLLSFGGSGWPPDAELPATWEIELAASPELAAPQLYLSFRKADALGWDVIVTWLPPEAGLGLALVDRLRRAAAPR